MKHKAELGFHTRGDLRHGLDQDKGDRPGPPRKIVTHAVVTVPAYPRTPVSSPISVLRIVNEATVAAIAYGLDKESGKSQIIVYDLDRGTFDVSFLPIDDGILSGEEGVEDVILIDVCPLTMGIETTGGVFTKLILRNTVADQEISNILNRRRQPAHRLGLGLRG
ncbi:hypothetical protein FRC08_005407 [Ceratobasidium sp. 394]|nr:hypothetical protein FRC08_005407 [Ceratobasidium sp. 394]